MADTYRMFELEVHRVYPSQVLSALIASAELTPEDYEAKSRNAMNIVSDRFGAEALKQALDGATCRRADGRVNSCLRLFSISLLFLTSAGPAYRW